MTGVVDMSWLSGGGEACAGAGVLDETISGNDCRCRNHPETSGRLARYVLLAKQPGKCSHQDPGGHSRRFCRRNHRVRRAGLAFRDSAGRGCHGRVRSGRRRGARSLRPVGNCIVMPHSTRRGKRLQAVWRCRRLSARSTRPTSRPTRRPASAPGPKPRFSAQSARRRRQGAAFCRRRSGRLAGLCDRRSAGADLPWDREALAFFLRTAGTECMASRADRWPR